MLATDSWNGLVFRTILALGVVPQAIHVVAARGSFGTLGRLQQV
jgi:hypothetical protein